MLQSFDETIGAVAFIAVHSGAEPHEGGRIYDIAATVFGDGRPERSVQSAIRYPYLTAREHYVSKISSETLRHAPEGKEVSKRIRRLVEHVSFVFVFDTQGCDDEIFALCGHKRIVDLTFAAEFFFPHIAGHSFTRIWEYLHGRSRRKISFTTAEAVELSIKLVAQICGTVLNDQLNPRAMALRFYLEKSNTLFGNALLHLSRHYQDYFGGLFTPCTMGETGDWKIFLERAKPIKIEPDRPSATENVSTDRISALFKDLTEAGKGFIHRPEQILYAEHVIDTLNDHGVLTIEAGTGTGKTLGYLIPVLAYLYRNKEARAVVSTYTKNLQEQIVQKEIRLARSVLKTYRDIPFSLLKGKSSYVCAEKLDDALDDNRSGPELLMWLYLVNMTYFFREADLDGIGEKIWTLFNGGNRFYRLLNDVSAKDGCHIRHVRCPAQVVTAEAYRSRLIITNHHKLALLDQDASLSGLFTHYVIDEASHFEQAVRNANGVEIRSGDLLDTVGSLSKTTKRVVKKNLPSSFKGLDTIQSDVDVLRRMVVDFRESLREISPQARRGNLVTLPENHPAFPDGRTTNILEGIRQRINHIRRRFEPMADPDQLKPLNMKENLAKRFRISVPRLIEFEENLARIVLGIGSTDTVTAFQCYASGWHLVAYPLNVADLIKEQFIDDKESMIFTSATLSQNGRFDSFAESSGISSAVVIDERGVHPESNTRFRFEKISSPFSDESRQIMVADGAVSGKYANKDRWLDSVAKSIPDLVRENRGRTLVLFSSYSDLEAVRERAGHTITEMNFPLLIQKKGMSTVSLCDEFRTVKESVLFGVDTFWYGVDFRGDTLTQVIITRLPYPSPYDPIQQGRKKTMSSEAYWMRYLYETHIKMRQGVGRLIRSETDRGRVVILDSRFKRGEG